MYPRGFLPVENRLKSVLRSNRKVFSRGWCLMLKSKTLFQGILLLKKALMSLYQITISAGANMFLEI